VVARFETPDTCPNLLHDPCALMAPAVGKVRDLPVGLGHVVVGVAEARSHHPDQHLMVPGWVEISLDDLPLPRLLHEHRRVCLHQYRVPNAPIGAIPSSVLGEGAEQQMGVLLEHPDLADETVGEGEELDDVDGR
jgi:hypothetical protein